MADKVPPDVLAVLEDLGIVCLFDQLLDVVFAEIALPDGVSVQDQIHWFGFANGHQQRLWRFDGLWKVG